MAKKTGGVKGSFRQKLLHRDEFAEKYLPYLCNTESYPDEDRAALDAYIDEEYGAYLKKYEERQALAEQCSLFRNRVRRLKIRNFISPVPLTDEAEENIDPAVRLRYEIISDVISRIATVLSRKMLTVSCECFRPDYKYRKYQSSRLVDDGELLMYIREFPCYGNHNWEKVITNTARSGQFGRYLYGRIMENCSSVQQLVNEGAIYRKEGMYDAEGMIRRKTDMYAKEFIRSIKDEVAAYFSPEKIEECILRNTYYADTYRRIMKEEHRARDLRKNMLASIPDTYPELFPAARSMTRHFVLHVGPTNSGKTYSAVGAFTEDMTCAYLAPLRLLAYEQFEKLNRNGIICSLKTGEERIDIPGSNCTASTIEMADLENEIDMAVIDEGQMISDLSRGGAWTAALLGLPARVIHVCIAPEAENIYMHLIRECGDTFETVRHERLCPLTVEKGEFNFPDDVRSGDALIVFSRKDVHAVASELQRSHIKTSVIYGKLPYDVRHAQAADFSEGQNPVLVATDAIGMGLNLPIRRVVFLSLEKFDGFNRRELLPGEIRQIAGRAGRKGIYDKGLVISEYGRSELRNALSMPPEDVENAVIAFPKSLISLDASLEEILKRWDEIPVKEGFLKEDMKEKLFLCHAISDISDDRDFLYKCITIPFESDNEYLFDLWKEMCRKEAQGRKPDIIKHIPDIPDRKPEPRDLETLEDDFRLCDLLYGFCDKFSYFNYLEPVMECKKELSGRIIRVLDKQELKGRTCKHCGRRLPWKYPYNTCEKCFEGISCRVYGKRHR
ncbi:MAG: hypothetical protein HUJ76_03715 [Parasporobacterium sp.]|nr:hypothetical protein [Parasporobacterium sp.]